MRWKRPCASLAILADLCGVSHTFVGERRKLLMKLGTCSAASSDQEKPAKRVGRDCKARKLPHRKAKGTESNRDGDQAAAPSDKRTWQQALGQLKKLGR
jgi:hypothetical protein